MQNSREPVDELDIGGLIEPEEAPQGGFVLGVAEVFSHHDVHYVAGYETDEEEGDHGNPEKDRDQRGDLPATARIMAGRRPQSGG